MALTKQGPCTSQWGADGIRPGGVVDWEHGPGALPACHGARGAVCGTAGHVAREGLAAAL